MNTRMNEPSQRLSSPSVRPWREVSSVRPELRWAHRNHRPPPAAKKREPRMRTSQTQTCFLPRFVMNKVVRVMCPASTDGDGLLARCCSERRAASGSGRAISATGSGTPTQPTRQAIGSTQHRETQASSQLSRVVAFGPHKKQTSLGVRSDLEAPLWILLTPAPLRGSLHAVVVWDEKYPGEEERHGVPPLHDQLPAVIIQVAGGAGRREG
mmetsp:Transcript_19269/g.46527  ORF Transcript_19269/g.46527 Transcript_19269/m.46527 type:complete len:211 (-) Transcript_19269:130-762(-)